MSDEVEYRAYVVGLDGHFIRPHIFIAEDDAAAVENARQFVEGHDIEIWSGARFILRLQVTK
jgi:hypothetical protein